jgi:hypothetical protein
MMFGLDRGFDLSNKIENTFRYKIDNSEILKIQSRFQDGFVSLIKVIHDPEVIPK